MKSIERLVVIRHKSKINQDWKYKKLFQILHKNDFWILAYINIKNYKSDRKFIITKENFDIMNLKRLERFREKIINKNSLSNIIKEFKTSELDNRKKLIGLPITNFKIIQEVISIILEALYKPYFPKQSFGYYKYFGTHDTLEYFELKFRWLDWIIEGLSLLIESKTFCRILYTKIKDIRFINLVYKVLKYERLFEGSNLSIISLTIYYIEFDKLLKKKVEVLYQSRLKNLTQNYKQILYQIDNIIELIKNLSKCSEEYKILLKELKILKIQKGIISTFVTTRIQFKYVHYQYNLIIGISGDKVLARQLKVELIHFMGIELNQITYPIKLNVRDLRSNKVKFLGYQIFFLQRQKMNHYNTFRNLTIYQTRTKPQLQFDIPIDLILKQMQKNGYIIKLTNSNDYRSISNVSYTILTDRVVLEHFKSIWIKLINYYSGGTNFIKLQYIQCFLCISCAMTLSHKHRSTNKKIFVKYEKILNVLTVSLKTQFPYQRNWQTKCKFVEPF